MRKLFSSPSLGYITEATNIPALPTNDLPGSNSISQSRSSKYSFSSAE